MLSQIGQPSSMMTRSVFRKEDTLERRKRCILRSRHCTCSTNLAAIAMARARHQRHVSSVQTALASTLVYRWGGLHSSANAGLQHSTWVREISAAVSSTSEGRGTRNIALEIFLHGGARHVRVACVFPGN